MIKETYKHATTWLEHYVAREIERQVEAYRHLRCNPRLDDVTDEDLSDLLFGAPYSPHERITRLKLGELVSSGTISDAYQNEFDMLASDLRDTARGLFIPYDAMMTRLVHVPIPYLGRITPAGKEYMPVIANVLYDILWQDTDRVVFERAAVFCYRLMTATEGGSHDRQY